jgi:hypothetical protein
MAEPLDDIELDRRIGALVRLFAVPALAERLTAATAPMAWRRRSTRSGAWH